MRSSIPYCCIWALTLMGLYRAVCIDWRTWKEKVGGARQDGFSGKENVQSSCEQTISNVATSRNYIGLNRAADKGWHVYPLDPRPDAVVLYSGCTPAKSCLDCPVSVVPHKSLNSCRGVISEPDLLTTTDAEILDGFSGQDVIQVRRITIKKDASIIPTKHIILIFNSPKLPTTIKAGYLNCKIRPYIPNPLRCFKCQRFGHSQASCRGQLTCSRCASAGHASTDCILEPKCINCSQSHPSDSKICPKWEN
ncbi:uncharacterized protein TNCV_2245981 [Trichonephila clavipes]|uniref:CCHC-type domain-containing protein n=1 Tax=Trichonephila clavipes TaxID=2585209 RepID=A0A8X6R7F3_TRICX|nr:uncharacterized protein TNCV_2245981 [Trichonephila clavipes]